MARRSEDRRYPISKNGEEFSVALFMDVHNGFVGVTQEAVLRVHDKAGHPASEIYELLVEVA
jgi:hypothetical protein